MEDLLSYSEYTIRNITYDIAAGVYYYLISQPEKFPDWLKEKFAFCKYNNPLEDYGNQIKMRYHYLTKNYTVLLSFMKEQKRRQTVLYGRIEMLAMEACVHYKMNNINEAYNILLEAYETSNPNNIMMPFIILGKDMRSLISSYARKKNCSIPQQWLKKISQATYTYAQNRDLVISDYKKAHGITENVSLSPREKEVLCEMYKGLNNQEIADYYNLSVNTIKLHINGIYNKLGARNRADVFRIANEHNLL